MSLSEVGSPSPRGLAKLRSRNKGLASTSTASLPLAGSSGDSDDTTSKVADSADKDKDGRLLAALDRVRSRRRSTDDRAGNSVDEAEGRLSTLISKTKRKVRRADRAGDLERKLSTASGTTGMSGNHSDSSLVLGDSGGSSLFTDDEKQDTDGNPIRPSLSPRQSHLGYLTLSAPDINAQTNAVVAAPDLVQSPGALPPNDPFTNIPTIVEPGSDSQVPSQAARERSSSTSNSRGPFTLARKKSDNGASGGGLGGIFKSSTRRNSLPFRADNDQRTKPEEAAATTSPQLDSSAKGLQQRPETPQRPWPEVNTTDLQTPPNLLETPTTLVTPPTPTDSNANASTFTRPTSSQKGSPTGRSLNSIESIRHRRAQSANLPSKLSSSITAPLTPTVEEAKTPGGTLTQPATATGFFTSVFSAAQKASAQFSNSINTTILPNQKGKPSSLLQQGETTGGEEVIPGTGARPSTGTEGGTKELAVDTLGQGSLSLSHLGISDSKDTSPMISTTELPQTDGNGQSTDKGRKAEEAAAARAVSSAYERPVAAVVSQATGVPGRPLSIASNDRLTLNGDQTPPRPAPEPDRGIHRSGSVRSKLSGRRKHRGSSTATAGTTNSIAAALRDSSAGLVNPSAHGAGHRLTGFAVASSKRNKDFHQLFRSVPEDDYLIEDYSAALQRDILLHGRLYVSEGHICFSSNILGWVTNLVISFDEVVSVEKKSTAVIFPNAIVISTLHARNTFASFVARDSTYELLIGIWKISHPNLKSSLNGVSLNDSGTGDKTEVAEPDASEEESDGATEDEIYDEDADDDDADSFADGGLAISNAGSEMGEATVSRKPSAAPVTAAPQANGNVSKGLESADSAVTGAALSSEFPGAPTHEPTQCSESGEHYERPLTDTIIPAPLGKIYSLMFGPASGAFMRKWLVEDMKSGNLNYVDDKTGLDNEHTSFTFDYIKPLGGPVGPKQTKCITTNTLKAFDLEKAISIDCSTQTPDVPSGNAFVTKTRYCLMWGPGNSTRMVATCMIEWSGKSWLRSAIDKGAEGGQIEYVTKIIAALKAAVTTKPPVKGVARKGKGKKGKKEVFDIEEAVSQREAAIAAEQKSSAWGPLEPLRQVLDPVLALVRPLISSQLIMVLLVVLLAYSWLAKPRGSVGLAVPGYTSPERIAAYEEIWRREESALWDWLEDRVGLDGVYAPPRSSQQHDRQKVLRAKEMGKALRDDRMSERQMDEQIRTTEEKLAALKEAVQRKKTRAQAS